jgi:hypothetical protein
MARWLKAMAVNSVLVLVACVIGYLLIEIVYFRVILPTSPPGLSTYLPETADIIAQNSKSGPVPHDYIAILGDSYAKGIGDWMLEAADNRALPFHSANVIHDRMRRDVASFGRTDIGSADALVRTPTHLLEGGNCILFPHIDDPASIVVYFYEGNDIRDNLLFLTKVNATYGGTDSARIDRYLSEVYAAFSRWRCHLHLGDMVARTVKLRYYVLRYGPRFADANKVQVNSLRMAGRTATAPYLEGPAVNASAEQIADGVRVFDRSLAWLRRRFVDIPVTVVYIPGGLSIYQFAGEKAFSYSRALAGNSQPFGEVPVAMIERNSALMCDMIRQASVDHGAGFIDARPPLRDAARTQFVHGPRDWFHLNRAGYTILGNLVADRLSHPDATLDDCGAVPSASTARGGG